MIDGRAILELKSVAALNDVHRAQVLSYLHVAKIRVGLLVNFNVAVLRNGIRRFVL